MSAPVTFGSMLASVQERSNTENGSVGNVTVPEMRGYINESLSELWDLLVEARGQEHMRKSFLFNANGSQSGYPLPPDFYEMISVDINLSPGNTLNPQFVNATPYMESQRNMYRFYPGLVGWYWGVPINYRIMGSPQFAGPAVAPKIINFIPTPQAAYPIQLNYYPIFVPFLTDGTQDSFGFDGVQGWEGFAIWGATALVLAKLRMDVSFAAQRQQVFRDRIQALADQNDAGYAERVHDVLAENLGWPGMGGNG
jgi:hypothetical protein